MASATDFQCNNKNNNNNNDKKTQSGSLSQVYTLQQELKLRYSSGLYLFWLIQCIQGPNLHFFIPTSGGVRYGDVIQTFCLSVFAACIPACMQYHIFASTGQIASVMTEEPQQYASDSNHAVCQQELTLKKNENFYVTIVLFFCPYCHRFTYSFPAFIIQQFSLGPFLCTLYIQHAF